MMVPEPLQMFQIATAASAHEFTCCLCGAGTGQQNDFSGKVQQPMIGIDEPLHATKLTVPPAL
jgi:hypothetical protein